MARAGPWERSIDYRFFNWRCGRGFTIYRQNAGKPQAVGRSIPAAGARFGIVVFSD